ncbi:MAG: hypothetical protein IIY15_05880, partial [Flavobacteriales bacterium]|nr:hypothetical protein [Flavobacteriales bacterium]
MKKSIIFGFAMLLLATLQAQKAPRLTPSNIDEVVSAMTLEEKAHIVVGADMSDRKAAGEVGYTEYIIPGAAGIKYPI